MSKPTPRSMPATGGGKLTSDVPSTTPASSPPDIRLALQQISKMLNHTLCLSSTTISNTAAAAAATARGLRSARSKPTPLVEPASELVPISLLGIEYRDCASSQRYLSALVPLNDQQTEFALSLTLGFDAERLRACKFNQQLGSADSSNSPNSTIDSVTSTLDFDSYLTLIKALHQAIVLHLWRPFVVSSPPIDPPIPGPNSETDHPLSLHGRYTYLALAWARSLEKGIPFILYFISRSLHDLSYHGFCGTSPSNACSGPFSSSLYSQFPLVSLSMLITPRHLLLAITWLVVKTNLFERYVFQIATEADHEWFCPSFQRNAVVIQRFMLSSLAMSLESPDRFQDFLKEDPRATNIASNKSSTPSSTALSTHRSASSSASNISALTSSALSLPSDLPITNSYLDSASYHSSVYLLDQDARYRLLLQLLEQRSNPISALDPKSCLPSPIVFSKSGRPDAILENDSDFLQYATSRLDHRLGQIVMLAKQTRASNAQIGSLTDQRIRSMVHMEKQGKQHPIFKSMRSHLPSPFELQLLQQPILQSTIARSLASWAEGADIGFDYNTEIDENVLRTLEAQKYRLYSNSKIERRADETKASNPFVNYFFSCLDLYWKWMDSVLAKENDVLIPEETPAVDFSSLSIAYSQLARTKSLTSGPASKRYSSSRAKTSSMQSGEGSSRTIFDAQSLSHDTDAELWKVLKQTPSSHSVSDLAMHAIRYSQSIPGIENYLEENPISWTDLNNSLGQHLDDAHLSLQRQRIDACTHVERALLVASQVGLLLEPFTNGTKKSKDNIKIKSHPRYFPFSIQT